MSKVLFVDSFEGPAGSKPSPVWSQYPYSPSGTTQDPSAWRLDGQGNLELVVESPSQAAALWTKGKFEIAPPFTATAWVKFPTSWQVWHSFWWEHQNWEHQPEIDFYEAGGLRDSVQGASHEWKSGVDTDSRIEYGKIEDPTLDFHRYGARVTTKQVEYQYDGVTYATLPLNEAFNQRGYFIIDHWSALDQNPKGFPSVIKVSRVQVTRN